MAAAVVYALATLCFALVPHINDEPVDWRYYVQCPFWPLIIVGFIASLKFGS